MRSRQPREWHLTALVIAIAATGPLGVALVSVMVDRLLPMSLIQLRASLDSGMTRVTWAMVALSPAAMLVAAWLQGRIVSQTRQQAGCDGRGWFKLSAFALASSIAQAPMFLSLVAYLMGGRVAPALIVALLSTAAVVGLWLLLERQLSALE